MAERSTAARRPPVVGFLLAALALAILLGASTGAWELVAMAFAVGPVLPSHLQLHAHVQILGFAGLLFAGIVLETLPGVFGVERPAPALSRMILAGLGGGVFLRAIGQPLAPWAAGRLICLLSGALEAGGMYLFAAWALPGLLRRNALHDPLGLHALAGTLGLSAAAVSSGAQALRLAGHAEAQLPASLVEPFYAVGLYGFALSFGYVLASRAAPPFCGARTPSLPGARLTLVLQAAGVLFLAGSGAWRAAAPVGALLVAAAAAVFLASSGLLSRAAIGAARAAGAALALFAVVSAGAAAAELAGRPVHKFVPDGARHLFTMGFLTLLALAAGLRLLPGAAGRAPARPRQARAGLALAGAAALLRSLQIPVALSVGGLGLYRVAGTSGLVALLGLILYAGAILATLRREPAAGQTSR